MTIRNGTVQGFESSFIQTNAPISPGDSGGAGLDANANVIGLPTRIVTITDDSTGASTVTYELVDSDKGPKAENVKRSASPVQNKPQPYQRFRPHHPRHATSQARRA